ncbi:MULTISPECIES: LysR substrate-binding domain-containing protein [Amycolatopsis]|uniref:LysR family transcriptional regulator n=1 Tax=Amycolatopsis echigonensis TaxID=2576905 RepID=A0A2N3WN85_9PSEU|nr:MULTISPECIES: LysR substrate-binding domain-containing protein [Amycolatopsis]PKV95337.1 LysR family transcriptional regulator [Amycolatopsis niigatensis]
MELRLLRYFVAVAEESHFGRAAERLRMAQPPLSRAIRHLEAELGVDLLERTTRRVALTPAGAAYLDEARAVLAAVDAARARARRVAEGREGRLTVGCVGSATYSLLPALARELRAELPAVEVRFRGEMLAPEQVAGLREGSLDLGLLRHTEGLAPDLRLTVLREDRLLVAVPQDHPLATRARLAIGDLEAEGLVLHSGAAGSSMHRLVTRLCEDAGFAPHVTHEVAETSTLLTFVAAGLGVAVVPEPTAFLGVPGVVHLPLDDVPTVPLVAATRDETDLVMQRALAILGRMSSSAQ